MDPLSVKIMMDSEEVTQCLVDRPSCLIDDSQLKVSCVKTAMHAAKSQFIHIQLELTNNGGTPSYLYVMMKHVTFPARVQLATTHAAFHDGAIDWSRFLHAGFAIV